MKIKWEVDDGYVGGSRPQYSNVDLLDIVSYSDNVEDAMEQINEWILEDFQNYVHFTYDYEEVRNEVEKLFEELNQEDK